METTGSRLACKFVLLSICIYHASAESSVENAESISGTEASGVNVELTTNAQTFRRGRAYRRGYNARGDNKDYQDDQQDHYDDDMDDHADDETDHGHTKAMTQPKVDYWAGYYDFLINEGSYKFWAVFQLATAALLIYSGFAALYYAKVNPPTTDDDFDDIFRRRRRRRRRRRSLPLAPRDRPFVGLDAVTFQRIVEAADAERAKR
ncbi:uncharacterized protein LOC105187289 [Harpegnathos saltator]|uniref:uncharacterized protein LOC105187289 n=1 Tax=Harpegnathos saltator TaxID=610380 RepID=UPI00058F0428|nr:uncharacterized protein LOC105187289 [Harpegnathos saltator]